MTTTTANKFRVGFLSEMQRYPAEGWLGGVCAGIADYFDWRIKLVRVAAVLLLIFTAGTVVSILYIFAWFVMDDGDAKTGPRPKWSVAPAASSGGSSGGAAPEASVDLGDLKARFTRLDDRLRRMEEAALSKDDALKREIDKL